MTYRAEAGCEIEDPLGALAPQIQQHMDALKLQLKAHNIDLDARRG